MKVGNQVCVVETARGGVMAYATNVVPVILESVGPLNQQEFEILKRAAGEIAELRRSAEAEKFGELPSQDDFAVYCHKKIAGDSVYKEMLAKMMVELSTRLYGASFFRAVFSTQQKIEITYKCE